MVLEEDWIFFLTIETSDLGKFMGRGLKV